MRCSRMIAVLLAGDHIVWPYGAVVWRRLLQVRRMATRWPAWQTAMEPSWYYYIDSGSVQERFSGVVALVFYAITWLG